MIDLADLRERLITAINCPPEYDHRPDLYPADERGDLSGNRDPNVLQDRYIPNVNVDETVLHHVRWWLRNSGAPTQ